MYVVFTYLVTDRFMLLDIVLLQKCAIGTTGLTGKYVARVRTLRNFVSDQLKKD